MKNLTAKILSILAATALVLALLPTVEAGDVLLPNADGDLTSSTFWTGTTADTMLWNNTSTWNTVPTTPIPWQYTIGSSASDSVQVAGLLFGATGALIDFTKIKATYIGGPGTLILGGTGTTISFGNIVGATGAGTQFRATIAAPMQLLTSQTWNTNNAAGTSIENSGSIILTASGGINAGGNSLSFSGNGILELNGPTTNLTSFTAGGLSSDALTKTVPGALVRVGHVDALGNSSTIWNLVGHSTTARFGGGIEFTGKNHLSTYYTFSNPINISACGKYIISQDNSVTLNGTINYSTSQTTTIIGLFVWGTNATGDTNKLTFGGDFFLNSTNAVPTTSFSGCDGSYTVFKGTIKDAIGATAQNVTFAGGGADPKGAMEFLTENKYTGTTTISAGLNIKVGHNLAFGTNKIIFSGSPSNPFFEAINSARKFTNDVEFGAGTGAFTRTFTGTNSIEFTKNLIIGTTNTAPAINCTMTGSAELLFSGDVKFTATVAQALVLGGTGKIRLTGNIADGAVGSASRLTLTAGAQVEISGANNSFTGGVSLTGGATIFLGNKTNALGTGAISVGNTSTGVITTIGNQDYTLANALTCTGGSGATFIFTGNNNITLTGGYLATVAGGNRTIQNNITTANKTLTFSTADLEISAATGSVRSLTFSGGGKTVVDVNIKSGNTSVADTLIVSGAGTVLMLNGTASYNGTTTVSAGGALGGSGTIEGQVRINPAGILEADKLTFKNGLDFTSGTAGTKTINFDNNDGAKVSGGTFAWAASAANKITLNINGLSTDWTNEAGAKTLLFDCTGVTSYTGDVANTNFTGIVNNTGVTPAGGVLSLYYNDGLTNILHGDKQGIWLLGLKAVVIPEPSTYLLLGASLLAVVIFRRRK